MHLIKRLSAVAAGAALAAFCLSPVLADTPPTTPETMPGATSAAMPMQTAMPAGGAMGGHMGMMKGGEHGMPPGGDGYAFTGKPDLAATISLVKLGGGPANFSIAKALTAMVGTKLTTAEVNKLTKQYGKAAVGSWIQVFDFSVQEGASLATTAGVKFPNSNLKGTALAARLVGLGVPGNNGAFVHGTLLDHLVTHPIHESTMTAIDAKFSPAADANYHRITNQAMYDLAQALGVKTVKLAAFH